MTVFEEIISYGVFVTSLGVLVTSILGVLNFLRNIHVSDQVNRIEVNTNSLAERAERRAASEATVIATAIERQRGVEVAAALAEGQKPV